MSRGEHVAHMSRDEYVARFGLEPKYDDIARAECAHAGKLLHTSCGVCPEHDKPRFICGCRLNPLRVTMKVKPDA